MTLTPFDEACKLISVKFIKIGAAEFEFSINNRIETSLASIWITQESEFAEK